MSIAVLTQVADEMRRLAIAGSVVAAGDFRLKKLLPPLEQAGAKAPVFAKVAESIKAVVDGPEVKSAESLLELTSLVNAVLYTQGETGIAGTLEEIETTDFGGSASQTNARTLKPLLESLSSTGSGRLEMIRDAHERGLFRDLRLVKPAIAAIDDPYPEIADLISEKVLPIYGKAVLSEVRGKLDLNGKAGHCRRLQLMHLLDPSGSREVIKKALETGSKEIKIAAIECLGTEPEDLAYLVEQSTAKNQDVRRAVYQALSKNHDDVAVGILQKAMTGKDLSLAAPAIGKSKSPKLLVALHEAIDQGANELPKLKDKKEVSTKIERLNTLVGCLDGRDDTGTEKLLSQLFQRRTEFTKIKGDNWSGEDFNQHVLAMMGTTSRNLKITLANAHQELGAEQLESSFVAAREVLPPEKVFEMFSPYLSAKVNEKKKQTDPAYLKRETIIDAMGGNYFWRHHEQEKPLDPRWIEIAVQIRHIGLIHALNAKNHPGVNAFLKEEFDETIKKAKSLDQVHSLITTMVRVDHPDATDAFLTSFEKLGKKANYYSYWYSQLVSELPKSAIPKLEAMLPTLSDRDADIWLGAIERLRGSK